MPVSPEFVARVTETFGAVRPVRVTKMFGGIGIYVGDAFFALGDDDRLYFKVDAQNLPSYEAQGMGPWVCNGRVNQKYRELPADVLANEEKLGEWIDEAVRVASTNKAPKKKAKSS